MKKHRISISPVTFDDIQDLYYAIVLEYKSPLTAKRYVAGLYAEIKSLEKTAEMFAIRDDRSLLQYGYNVRCINYKKMAVIYTINGSDVYVLRVVASSMITD